MTGCVNQGTIEPDLSTFDERDLTGDGVSEIVQVQYSDVAIAPAYTSEYPYVVNMLAVMTPGDDGDRMILALDESGVTVESGDTVPAVVANSTAYGMNYLGNDLFVFVQIDVDGFPVSEPLAVNWNDVDQRWVMGPVN